MKKTFSEGAFAVFGVVMAVILGYAWLTSNNPAFERNIVAGVLSLIFGTSGLAVLIYNRRGELFRLKRKKKVSHEALGGKG